MANARKPKVLARLEQLDLVFNALAHPARRQMLLALKIMGEMTAGEIASRFSCAWPTVTRHLAVLRGAGLIAAQKRGRTVVYRMDPRALAILHDDYLRHFKQ